MAVNILLADVTGFGGSRVATVLLPKPDLNLSGAVRCHIETPAVHILKTKLLIRNGIPLSESGWHAQFCPSCGSGRSSTLSQPFTEYVMPKPLRNICAVQVGSPTGFLGNLT